MKKDATPLFVSTLGSGIKIKICGLSRPCDIDYVNEAAPDFCGFIIQVPRSRRNVSIAQLRELRARLASSICPVGVFVNAPVDTVASLLRDGTIAAAQLHGTEDEDYLAALRKLTDGPVIQAFSIAGPGDIERAQASSADCVLLDNGTGGTGASFDWQFVREIRRPFILAGGLTPENLAEAVACERSLSCQDILRQGTSCQDISCQGISRQDISRQGVSPRYLVGLDLSSGVETNGYKDREKISAAVAAVRRINYE